MDTPFAPKRVFSHAQILVSCTGRDTRLGAKDVYMTLMPPRTRPGNNNDLSYVGASWHGRAATIPTSTHLTPACTPLFDDRDVFYCYVHHVRFRKCRWCSQTTMPLADYENRPLVGNALAYTGTPFFSFLLAFKYTGNPYNAFLCVAALALAAMLPQTPVPQTPVAHAVPVCPGRG